MKPTPFLFGSSSSARLRRRRLDSSSCYPVVGSTCCNPPSIAAIPRPSPLYPIRNELFGIFGHGFFSFLFRLLAGAGRINSGNEIKCERPDQSSSRVTSREKYHVIKIFKYLKKIDRTLLSSPYTPLRRQTTLLLERDRFG